MTLDEKLSLLQSPEFYSLTSVEQQQIVNDTLSLAISQDTPILLETRLSIIQYLVDEHKADVNEALVRAIRVSDPEHRMDIIRYLVEEQKADVNYNNGLPLIVSVNMESQEISNYATRVYSGVQQLLDLPEYELSYTDIIMYLVEHGANMNTNRTEVLRIAATTMVLDPTSGQMTRDFVELLLNLGANPVGAPDPHNYIRDWVSQMTTVSDGIDGAYERSDLTTAIFEMLYPRVRRPPPSSRKRRRS